MVRYRVAGHAIPGEHITVDMMCARFLDLGFILRARRGPVCVFRDQCSVNRYEGAYNENARFSLSRLLRLI